MPTIFQNNYSDRTQLQNQAWERENFINWSRFKETIKLAPPISDDGIVYDIASGPAHFAQYLVDQNIYSKSQIICLDLSPIAIKGARDRGYRGEVLDIENQPADIKADVIFFLEALEHTTNPARVIKNLYDSLKPGGYLIISTPNYARFDLRLKGYRPPTSNDIWQTSGSSRMSIPMLVRLLQQEGFGIESSHHLFQLESLGRIWKKLIKPRIKIFRQRFPYPDYNYVPISIFTNQLASLILIRARKP